MNPVLSDLDIRISTIEAAAGLQHRQRLHLARVAPAGARSGFGSTLLNVVRQFLDPRGYALGVLRARERSQTAPSRGDIVTVLSGRPAGQDAELPVAA